MQSEMGSKKDKGRILKKVLKCVKDAIKNKMIKEMFNCAGEEGRWIENDSSSK
jgi:predicted neutral ceramidase superfamily lipid hydrolase